MATVNERLQSASIGHAVDLQHLSNAEVRKIVSLLNGADADLRKLLIEAIMKAGTDTYTAQRMNTVLASVLELNKAIYSSIGETLEGIVSGETDGMQAFMGGKLRAEGDMMLAMKLSELFPEIGRASCRERV